MDRRDVLRGGVVGVGALALPLDAFAGADDEVRRVLARVDRHVGRVVERMRPLRELLISVLPAEDQGIIGHAQRAILASVVYGEISAVRPARQSHPSIQARIAQAALDMAGGLREVVGFLERIGPDRWAEIQGTLFADRARLNHLLGRISDEVSDAGLPPGAVRQLDNTARRLAFRMEERGAQPEIGEIIDQFRRLEATVQAAADPMEPVRAATPASLNDEVDAAPASASGGAEAPNRDMALGALLLGVGVVGAGLYVVAAIATGGYLVWCVCVSIPLVLGLGLVLAAGVMLLMGDKS